MVCPHFLAAVAAQPVRAQQQDTLQKEQNGVKDSDRNVPCAVRGDPDGGLQRGVGDIDGKPHRRKHHRAEAVVFQDVVGKGVPLQQMQGARLELGGEQHERIDEVAEPDCRQSVHGAVQGRLRGKQNEQQDAACHRQREQDVKAGEERSAGVRDALQYPFYKVHSALLRLPCSACRILSAPVPFAAALTTVRCAAGRCPFPEGWQAPPPFRR